MNKKIVILISIVVIIFIIIIYQFNSKESNKNNLENSTEQETSKEYQKMIDNSTMYDKNSTLEDLKEEYKIIGDNEIYEVEIEKDGRKVIDVKADIGYKVAFCGMIKEEKPKFEELDSIYELNRLQESGVWINKSDRTKILSYLNSSEYLKSKYKIDEEGYLQVLQINAQTEYDKKIESLINSKKQYLISISSTYYMVDTVTGQIVDNPYNELDEYQTYDYRKDEDKTIIFISENKNMKLNTNEIFLSIIDLLEIVS